ncbi:hypothetical protein GSM20_003595 [Escherichia coli]|nr:hypothetical protein [Escherichia coli]EES8791214.1 hypothetical protein [Escherichia coli]EEW4060737.1 hypothetical protein [Escherichia coli]EEX5900111.1 hypothetical protein [Escherichia coli]EEX9595184.1 hypothetical protein [Escherichia coli]
MKQEPIIICKDGDQLEVDDNTMQAVAKLLGITATDLRKSVNNLFKAESNKPSHQGLINAKAEQLKLTIKGNK